MELRITPTRSGDLLSARERELLLAPSASAWRDLRRTPISSSRSVGSSPTLAAPYLASPRTERPRPSDGYTWNGVIVARAWPADMTLDEYLYMACGGSKRRFARPDAYAPGGRPVWYLSEYQQRTARRLLDRECLDGFESHNVGCNGGRSLLLNFVGNVITTNTGVKYFAVGTGALPGTGPSTTDTTLVSEFFRKVLTATALSTTQIDLNCVFQAAEANTTFTEAGPFGGSGATGSANTGTLYAHAPYPYIKTSAIVLSNDYYISLN